MEGRKNLLVTSSKFKHGGKIPTKYTCDGKDISPPISIEGIPEEAGYLTLIMDDPDAPGGTFVHWLMWNIPKTSYINEGSSPGEEGINSFKHKGYRGPCPPSGTHRYFFKIYALAEKSEFEKEVEKAELERSMKGKTLAYGELIGLYSGGD